ncbi:MAG: 5'/3'-nucleotidase SurE [Firmicutes bacterium]|nr:5'/3'-nucleotidase SurE [Bacillota bacterium]
MRVLVTNDDGIFAPGLHTLVEFLSDAFEVTVVAPDREMSAMSHAITVTRPLRVTEYGGFGSKIPAYMIDGTPSDCVKLAVDALSDRKFDIVVSGINSGPNLGTDVLYSGTVSGAIEGVINGLPAIAVSAASAEKPNYYGAALFTVKLVKLVLSKGLPEDTLLNVNVPTFSTDQFPVKVTRLGKRRYINVFDKRTDPRGREYYWMAGDPHDSSEDDDADTEAVQQGYISVTPLHLDLTSDALFKDLQSWSFDEK